MRDLFLFVFCFFGWFVCFRFCLSIIPTLVCLCRRDDACSALCVHLCCFLESLRQLDCCSIRLRNSHRRCMSKITENHSQKFMNTSVKFLLSALPHSSLNAPPPPQKRPHNARRCESRKSQRLRSKTRHVCVLILQPSSVACLRVLRFMCRSPVRLSCIHHCRLSPSSLCASFFDLCSGFAPHSSFIALSALRSHCRPHPLSFSLSSLLSHAHTQVFDLEQRWQQQVALMIEACLPMEGNNSTKRSECLNRLSYLTLTPETFCGSSIRYIFYLVC